MQQNCEGNICLTRAKIRSDIQGHQKVRTGIDLRVVFFRLRHTKKGVHLRQQGFKGLALAQHADEDRRFCGFHRPLDFTPGSLGSQVLKLS